MSIERAHALNAISEISLNGYVTRKLDFLGTVHIYGVHYFNVFRRYNNVYEIVLEDFYGDFHYHKDYTVRQSLQRVLCLLDEQMQTIHVRHATSFKHGSYPINGAEAVNMRWSDIHAQWQGVALDVGGILEDYHRETAKIKEEITQDTPCAADYFHIVNPVMNAPLRPSRRVMEDGHGLSVQSQNLSDRFAEVENKKRTWTQLSESESEEEEEEEEEESEESEESEEESEEEEEEEEQVPEFLVLRNGTKVQRK